MTTGKLPRDLSGQAFRKAVERVGFELRRQRGSHMILSRAEPPAMLVVPDHDSLRPGLLRKLIDQAGLTPDEFLKLIR